MAELIDERKQELKRESNRKLEFIQLEYWRMQNGKQSFMRCPFCRPFKKQFHSNLAKNHQGCKDFCCGLFARAFKAILDRQDEVNKAAKAAKDIVNIADMVHSQQNGHLIN